MKLVCISDLHNNLSKVELPPADVLVIAGDLTKRGTFPELATFNYELEKVKDRYKAIIYIAGNHELLHEEDLSLAKSVITNASYLHDSMEIIKIGDEKEVRFYGSPHSLFYNNWAFNIPRDGSIKAKWDLIPNDTDVLITHMPPYGILDEADEYSGHVGCPDLLDAVLRVKPKVHVFGHIHYSYGIKDFNGTTFINASVNNLKQMPINKPIEIEI